MKYLLLLLLICVAATLPPSPKKFLPLLSPKDAANRSKVAVTPIVVFLKKGYLVWNNQNTVSTGFVIEHKTSLKKRWTTLGRVTNTCIYPIVMTNKMEFYRVGAFFP